VRNAIGADRTQTSRSKNISTQTLATLGHAVAEARHGYSDADSVIEVIVRHRPYRVGAEHWWVHS
jgi:hypothetical protein